VTAPVHVFSTAHTPLTAGTKYWLVIAPGASDTVAQWNLCLDDFSIPNTTTLLVTSSSNVNGPWTMKSALAELRPAFEIDVRE
jgi:hypothetical protein